MAKQISNPHPMIGKKVYYRKPFDQHHKTATVISTKMFENWHGARKIQFIMDNGDEIASTACFIECVVGSDN